MTTQKYIKGIDAREKMFKGADDTAEVVIQSIGPFGLNVYTQKGEKTTNDGFLISKSISDAIKDEFERRGALMQHQASSKTNEKVADATSTTIALQKGIRQELIKYLPTKTRFVSLKPISELRKQLESERDYVIAEMKKDVVMIESEADLISSAKVSVEDQGLANLIGKTQWELGADGIIIAEEVNETESSIEKVDGLMIDNGFVSSLMINNPEKQSLELKNASIVLTNHTISSIEPLKTLITQLAVERKSEVVLMARAFTQDVIAQVNELAKGGFMMYLINAPFTNQSQIMKDLAAVTGAKYYDQDETTLNDLNITDVGSFSKVSIQIRGGVITGHDNEATKERIKARVEILEQELAGEKSTFQQKEIAKRLAQFKAGFAILKVGAHTTGERGRLKDKCDDAVVSTRLALKGGTVAGAGLAFKRIAEKMDEKSLLKRPLQIVYNHIIGSAPEGYVVEEWVRDPYITLETALTNACETAGLMASINGAVVTRDVKTKDTSYEDEQDNQSY